MKRYLCSLAVVLLSFRFAVASDDPPAAAIEKLVREALQQQKPVTNYDKPIVPTAEARFGRQLIGEWKNCGLDNCTIMTLTPRHTFSYTFENYQSPYESGTWQVDGNRLMLRFARNDSSSDPIAGKRIVYTILWREKMLILVPSDRRYNISEWRRNASNHAMQRTAR